MPEISKPYAPGTPNWVDIGVSDLNRSQKFYSALFGWTFEDLGPDMGDYSIVEMNKKSIAGMSQNPPEEKTPVRWTTYLATNDIEATIDKIKAEGGEMLTEVMGVPGKGRMAIAQDCCQAAFGLWQQEGFVGSELVNEPGSPVWHELMSRDVTSARRFYQNVFGYEYGQMDNPEMDYTTIEINDRPVGGIYDGKGVAPEGQPSSWSVCFAVADTDDLVTKAEKAGAKIITKPMDSPYGRFAQLTDPDGASFAVMQVSPSTSPEQRRVKPSETKSRK